MSTSVLCQIVAFVFAGGQAEQAARAGIDVPRALSAVAAGIGVGGLAPPVLVAGVAGRDIDGIGRHLHAIADLRLDRAVDIVIGHRTAPATAAVLCLSLAL